MQYHSLLDSSIEPILVCLRFISCKTILPVTEFPLASVTEITTWVTGFPLASIEKKTSLKRVEWDNSNSLTWTTYGNATLTILKMDGLLLSWYNNLF